jgi:hypothetical protein
VNLKNETNCELLVNNKKLYLTDFGWGTINKRFHCGVGLDSKKKPTKIYNDIDVIPYLDKLWEQHEKISVSSRRNKEGSQSEVPKIKIKQSRIFVSGYQKYIIYKDRIDYETKKQKYNKIKEILLDLKKKHNIDSVTDIGCSAGIASYISYFLNINKTYALDHDNEYLEIIRKINNKFNITNVIPEHFSFGDSMVNSDVIMMLALIHWIYSCTNLYGNFKDIFEYLNKYVNKYLLIEWIDPNDKAIQIFNHINYNKDIIKEEYSKENFEKGLKIIGEIEDIIPVDGPTRVLYIVRKTTIA